MLVRVLGSAAGGGFPQWNCNCGNCSGLRAGTLKARRRTQSSIAVSVDGRQWVICNASPDIHQQIAHNSGLQPHQGVRGSGIAAVLLVDGQIDHSTGLLLLREHGAPLELWTTDPVREDLSTGLPILKVLEYFCGVHWHRVPVDGSSFELPALPGVQLTALPVAGKPGPYSAYRDKPRVGDNVGLIFKDQASGRQLFYSPGLAAVPATVAQVFQSSDCVLVDGTFWSDDEMIRAGVSHKRASDLGHLPQSGPDGMIEQLARLPKRTRRILIHINNTNPILDEAGAQRAQLDAAGIEVAHDGLEITL
ncbi:MAG TPA: pyrroloquinoline quinone biosynthesis protein PqqB [Steroidobacteraceae bacterium]